MQTLRKVSPSFLIAVLFLLASCHTGWRSQSIEYIDYRVTSEQKVDSSLIYLLQPYTDSVKESMNIVIGHSNEALDRAQPEGGLGNFMVDAMYYMAGRRFNVDIDAAVVNHGGIRLTQLPAGAITLGHVYELMPFDNLIVLQELKGAILQQFLDHIAARGGWPVAGLTMQIKNQKAVNVRINGQALHPDSTYTIANSDYITNGGDNSIMLKGIPVKNLGYLYRDAIADYIKFLESSGRPVAPESMNRVTYVQ